MKIDAPYRLYEEQLEYIQTIREGMSKQLPLLLEAGTGFGKTISNLIGILPLALENDEKVAYLSRTHTQNEQVLLELKKLIDTNLSLAIKSVQIASRRQLCHINSVSHAPNAISSILCQKNRERIRRYSQGKIHQKIPNIKEIRDCISPFSTFNGKKELNRLPNIITIRELVQLREKVGGCAYLAARDLLSKSLLFTGHYNYFLDPSIRESIEISENVHLILDEGHNLEEIATSIMSETLNSNHFDQAISFASLNHLSSLMRIMMKIKSKFEELETLIPRNRDQFFMLMADFHEKNPHYYPENLYYKLSSIYNANKDKIEELYQKQSSLDHSTSPFQRVISFLEKMLFKGLYEHYGIIIEKKRNDYLTWRLVCLDPSLLLKPLFSNARSVIICSGTLSPLDLHSEILGIPHAIKKSFSSITSKENILLLQVSRGHSPKDRLTTKFSARSQAIFEAYKSVILDLIDIIPGGILVFVPSYSLLDELKLPLVHSGIEIFHEEPKIKPEAILNDFRQSLVNNGKAMLVGVFGGKFSEGANFPQKESRCVACVGIPYPPINDPIIRLKRQYYERKKKGLGSKWYSAQAFQRVAQALGRGWRGKNDYAVGLLLDERYEWKENIQNLPDWMRKRTIKTRSWNDARKRMLKFFENRQ